MYHSYRRNADEDLRKKHRASLSGDVNARIASINAQLRIGQLSRSAVQYAGLLGDSAAQQVAGITQAEVDQAQKAESRTSPDELLRRFRRELPLEEQFLFMADCLERVISLYPIDKSFAALNQLVPPITTRIDLWNIIGAIRSETDIPPRFKNQLFNNLSLFEELRDLEEEDYEEYVEDMEWPPEVQQLAQRIYHLMEPNGGTLITNILQAFYQFLPRQTGRRDWTRALQHLRTAKAVNLPHPLDHNISDEESLLRTTRRRATYKRELDWQKQRLIKYLLND